jgi:hypothetical protein
MDSTDMSTPVTRRELQEAIAPLATKTDLEIWGGALLARIQQGEQLIKQLSECIQQTRQQLSECIQASEQRLLAELARHTSAVYESMRAQVTASAEPYADLPGRVSRVETAVFGPTPR